MADALTRIDAWLTSRLLADGTLMALLATDATHAGVYVDEITPAPLYPAVVVTAISGLDVTALGPQRNAVNALYLVKAIGQGRVYAEVATIMDRVDTVLQSTGGVTYTGNVWTVVREQSVKYLENDVGNRPFAHLGGRYRILAPPQ